MWAKGATEPITTLPHCNPTSSTENNVYLSLSLKKSQAKLVVIRTQKKEQILVLFVGIRTLRNPNKKYTKMQKKTLPHIPNTLSMNMFLYIFGVLQPYIYNDLLSYKLIQKPHQLVSYYQL